VIQQRTVRQKRTAQVQAALYLQLKAVLQMLRDDFAQHHLFGEVLGSDADARAPG
jgi:hypothetical protein